MRAFILSLLTLMSLNASPYGTVNDAISAMQEDTSQSSYRVLSDTSEGRTRTLKVELSERISERELHRIAHELADSDLSRYYRIFIYYYLSGESVHAGYWATSHFTPYLHVKILSESNGVQSSGSEWGTWKDERPFNERTIRLFKQGNTLYMTSSFSDRRKERSTMSHSKTPEGIKIVDKKRSGFGEYYLLKSDQSLEFYDMAGKVFSAPRLD